MHWFLYSLIGLGILYVLVCLAYYALQHRIIFHPKKIPNDFVYQYSVPFEELFLETSDGNTLNGLICQQENSKGLVLYFHGNSSHVFDLGWMAETIHAQGYDFALFDYRSYGKSTGILTEKNLFDDAQTCYHFMAEKYGYQAEDIIIYGRSIGSGIAVKLASEKSCKMLVLETPYASLLDLGKYYTPFLPYQWLMRFPLNSEKHIKKVEVPVYILHGTQDKIVPYNSGRKLANATPNLAEFITIEGANHNNIFEYPSYQKAVSEILGS